MKFRDIAKKFNIKSEQEPHDVIHDTVEKGIYFKGTNLWILIFAILIACVGLNVNSTAVIIGAMLISPLMGPILGMGYSLATYDFGLFRKALTNFGFAVFAGLSASTLYFLVTPISEAHSELLARTSPNIYDVIIALVGGLAGIVALSSKQKGNVIPGVAIATALMPPLCTAGYGLANGAWTYFFGAFYLFTINTVFIGVATLIAARFLKYPVWHYAEEGTRKVANRWVSVIVTVTMVPSIYFGYMLVRQERFTQEANAYIRNDTYIEGDYLLKSEVDPAKKTIRLIYGGRLIPESLKEDVAAKIRYYRLTGASVTIQQGFSVDDSDDQVLVMDRQQTEISRLRQDLEKSLRMQDSLRTQQELGRQLLNELKPLFPEVVSCGTAEQVVFDDSLRMTSYPSLFVGTSDLGKTSEQRRRIEDWFKSRLTKDSVKVYIEPVL
ncbi:DUF389 domain-containing protein [Parapedobacter koreensis]|uniref:Uncharacterized hydrophobic domain-containing protein n=1 Tax=Parapedobacter koreensis TaxID=332977 RepID=A0A1H7MF67_9SPHI|nr:DUF389 domain-containing protein [Parapedobacter koreensis]SEL09812.1 uncharacterized hydrophobic domain-containing protein [Parapedobacter koreensis]